MARPKLAATLLKGAEPIYKGPIDRIQLVVALNYYSQNHDLRTSRKWLDQYVKVKHGDRVASTFKNVPDKFITQTMCSMARILNNGAKFKHDTLDARIKSLLSKKISKQTTPKKPNHSENPLIIAIEDRLDAFYKSGYKLKYDPVTVDSKAADIKQAVEFYTSLLNELRSIDSCPQLKEAYAFLSKASRTRYVAFVAAILASLGDAKPTAVKKPRKPRKKKIKTPSQIVKGLKYLSHDKMLNITSIKAEKIVDTSVVWVYNTKTRKLIKYVAEKGSVLSVKGTTIIGFSKLSFSKTIRKPKDVIPSILVDGKRAIDSNIGKIRAKAMLPKGRINKDTLILRAFK